MSTEKSRNLMLKSSTSTPSVAAASLSSSVNNAFKGASLRTALESQNHPTTFVAVSSEFDNQIIVTCPSDPVKNEKNEIKQKSERRSSVEERNISLPEGCPTMFVPMFDSAANNPFIVTCPPL